LAGGLYDKASWLLIPSQVEEDFVRTFKPTDNSGSLSFTRASDATRTNAAGEIERTPWNLSLYSEMFSDSSWQKTNATVSPNTTIAPNGTLTADTITNNTGTIGNILQTIAVPNNSSSYNSSFYVRKQSGFLVFIVVFANGTSVGSAIHFNKATGQYQSVNSSFGFSGVATNIAVEDLGDYFKFSYALANNSTGNTALRLEIQPHRGTSLGNLSQTNGSAITWGAQLVEGTDAKPYFATTNRQDVPRLDYRNADGTLNSCPRLLLEPQRTNGIRNSSMVGAVAGSPGTLPTNWSIAGSAGLTQTIVGVGTENGIQYIDVKLSGTAIGTDVEIRLESQTQIVAANAQVWTQSIYLKTISEPSPPASYRLFMIERTAGGSSVASGLSSNLSVNSSLNRFSFTRTLSGGVTVERVQPSIFMSLTIGATYDFTIRIAAPQMELGAYATTFIPTTTAAVTRLADAASKTGGINLLQLEILNHKRQSMVMFHIDFMEQHQGVF